MIYTIFGILSAVIFVIGDTPYFIDTLKNKTQPQRVTWGVIFLGNAINTASQVAVGATTSLLPFFVFTFVTGAIFAASIKNGVGGYSRGDVFAILASLAGLSLWIMFDEPIISIVANIFVSFVSLTPTFIKAWSWPESETRIAWLLGAISSAFAVASTGELRFELIILPLNGVLLQLVMVYLLYVRQKTSESDLVV